ncbi:acetylornithine deacetylase [Priestia filamentosa]|uniref:Acetylornithine deacetylase n=1 Tax=Priestia filamentosa TaxID=1402861 RepID=A0A0H4KQU3_9BACI|nr:acetylornithine deacetylase [Priestia filamentosa]AKO94714.1 acetylornithine deacetylase [Priestia filamentosa]
MEHIEKILGEVELRKEELISLIEKLVKFKTPAPPARNTKEAQEFVAKKLKQNKFTVEMWDVYENDPNVVGVKKGKNSEEYNSLIINGHIDVAQVDENEQWERDPFLPFVRDGYLFGRGTSDMKGGLGCALFALELLENHGVELPGDVIFQSVIGEEVGEAGTKQCCERGYSADFALVVDTSEMVIRGQGGVITGWITVKSDQTFHDGARRHMIAAGGEAVGASAIEKMMKIINWLNELERHWMVIKTYDGFLPGTTTINPAVIEGGRHPAFVADECRLWITVHFYPNETYESVTKEIEDYILRMSHGDLWLRDHPPRFKWGGASMIEERGEIFPALEIDETYDGVKMLQHVHKEILKKQVEIEMSTSVTDGGWLGEAGIPTVIYGPGETKYAHAINERVSIESLVDFTKVLIEFIYNWCHTKRGGINDIL